MQPMHRKVSQLFALAALAAAVPSSAHAQLSRLDRGGVLARGGEVARSSTRGVPPGQLPPRGMCRVWIDGTPPGRQPRPTDCATAERERARYGSRARVLYGDDTSFRGRGRDDRLARDGRSERRYETVIDGRQCEVRERLQGGQVVRSETRCDRDRNDDRFERRRRERDDVINRRVRGDDDSDDRDDRSHGKGRGHGHGRAGKHDE
jgi:hypothetical protein